MSWEPIGDGLIRCSRHHETKPWGPREPACEKCKTDPGPELEQESLDEAIEAPDGCLTLEEHEAKMIKLGDKIAERASELFNQGAPTRRRRRATAGNDEGRAFGRISFATAFKGYEVARRYYQNAIDLASIRERRTYVARLEAIDRALNRRHKGGHGGGN